MTVAVIGGQPRVLDAWKPTGRKFASVRQRVDLASLRMSHTIEAVPTDYDQGRLGSCGANAVGEMFEFDLHAKFSRLFLYYWTRATEGDIDEDAGVTIPDMLDVAHAMGVPLELSWPYDVERFRDTPPMAALTEAIHHRILQQDIVADLDQLLFELDSNQPVIFGFQVPSSMQRGDAAATGLVQVPSDADPPLGGHCCLFFGFDRERQLLKATCHYGSGFGDHGAIWLPFAHVLSGNVMDMRAIRAVS